MDLLVKKASALSEAEFNSQGLSGIPLDWPVEVSYYLGGEIPEGFELMTEEELNQLKQQNQTAYNSWANAKKTLSADKVVESKIKQSKDFGNNLLSEFAKENVLMGITQAGKTRQVSDYLHALAHYISTGSLYAAMQEIDDLISSGLDESLAPFVTEQRLLNYKQKIAEYLGL